MLRSKYRRTRRVSAPLERVSMPRSLCQAVGPGPVFAAAPRHLAELVQVVEVRDRLHQRQAIGAAVDPALEQGRETFRRRARAFGDVVAQPRQCAVVIVDQLPHPGRQTGEGHLVAGQHQVAFEGEGLQRFAGGHPVAQGIGIRLGGIDADIGRNRRQQLIAADDEILVPAPESRMIGGVAVAEADVPGAPAHLDRRPLEQTREPKGHRMDDIGEVERPLGATLGQHVRRHACIDPELHLLLRGR
mmetsp:Transcript_3544/g.6394  ORF Transcript_3544/g.6394 Transcript_3544/m.6394 type:complete len:245 (+) Transcript_3544:859-1593(+)